MATGWLIKLLKLLSMSEKINAFFLLALYYISHTLPH